MVLRSAEGLSPKEAGQGGVSYHGTRVRLLWDTMVPTDRPITHRRPDILIYDEERKIIFIIDVAVSSDKRVLERALEKATKYQDLANELARTNVGWKTKVVPAVIGTLGNTLALEQHIGDLEHLLADSKEVIADLQQLALLGTVMTLKRHLVA